MEAHQFPNPRAFATSSSVKVADNDRSSGELRALGCNLTSLCDHIQTEGFEAGAFSDVVVHAMSSTYYLHRLILSRSSYFRNMLHGPWKEASSPVVNLHVDDDNINAEAITIALAYLYGHHPKLNDNNAFRVLAAACFLDLQDLCVICTDFIISELWTSNFLAYQMFAENQDYGIHGERVRNACWGYLCQSGTMELREVLPRLSSHTLQSLLTSDELWVPSEEKRFELALYTLLAKGALLKTSYPEENSSKLKPRTSAPSDSIVLKGKNVADGSKDQQLMETEFEHISLQDLEGHKAAHNILVELVDCVIDLHSEVSGSTSLQANHDLSSQFGSRNSSRVEEIFSKSSTIPASDSSRISRCHNSIESNRIQISRASMEGPSDENSRYQLNNSNVWISRDQSRHCSVSSSFKEVVPNSLGRCGGVPSSWGCRIVGRNHITSFVKGSCGVSDEDYDAFVNIFEGGSLLYCNMSFEALLNVRRQLEELGFPCKAVNDGLWLQMLLSHRVQEVGADTCKHCCLTSMACACRHPYGVPAAAYYRQDHDRSNSSCNLGNVDLADPQSDGSNPFGPVRVHVRGPIDGLAGIGRGTNFVPPTAWPPTRFVFSRVPFGLGSRNGQQPVASDESEARLDLHGDLSGDGLTALVGLSQGNSTPVENSDRSIEPDIHGRVAGTSSSVPSSIGTPLQMQDSQEIDQCLEWETAEGSSISLDLKTPLRHFPPFRFGVEFEDVHRLTDGQVKHSPEVFYAGSLWKVSVQAFNDEDPQGRRTLGLFLHRRKAELIDSFRKVHIYVDSREKVTARYQLICPSKGEVMLFGNIKQTGTLLPKAPKGWGWRTALLFDELADLLQGGALRVAAVVQLV